MYHQKLALVRNYEKTVQRQLVTMLRRLEHTVNRNLLSARRAVLADSLLSRLLQKALVPMTPDQIKREAIRQYNGGHEYYLDETFSVAANGLSLIAQGPDTWQLKAHLTSPNYVNGVLSCHLPD